MVCVENERVALLQFKDGIRVDHCGLLDSWGSTLDCCLWRGIQCDSHSGHVITIHLHGSQINYYDYTYKPCLEGTLGVSLLELKHLKYLNLSYNNFQGQTIPKFVGSLANLKHLDLTCGGFGGIIPQEIGNLSALSSLVLNNNIQYGAYYNKMRVESLSWLSQLRMLREVDLSGIDLSVSSNTWFTVVNSLPFLQKLSFDRCELSLKLPSSLSYNNSSTTLTHIRLMENNMNDTAIFEWLFNLTGLNTNLVLLDLSYNHQMFQNSLQMSKTPVKFLSNLCSLQTLRLSSTNLNYDFSDIIQSFSACVYKTLVYLNLGKNNVWGFIADSIGVFRSLKALSVNNNKLNGNISPMIGQLYNLVVMDLDSNSLKGALTTTHFRSLSKLSLLRLGNNTNLVFNISANWIPPFQLEALGLSSCKVGPDFPKWLLTQNHLALLDISNTSISDIIPVSFWNSSLLSRIKMLIMSHNMIYGTLPNKSIIFHNAIFIDLSFNNFEGSIPSFLRNNVSTLLLNNNKLSKGLVSFLCPKIRKPLVYLDLSNNLFSEKLPNCWGGFNQLFALHLEGNSLRGNLPASIGKLEKLGSLQLSNNNLSGELPTSLVNCKSLIILNLANNSMSGYIPSSYGYSFQNLSILSLHNNFFYGGLPSSFCHLSQLQLLDLSQNNISGTIPRGVSELVGMANTDVDLLVEFENVLREYTPKYVYENVRVMWKGNEQTFGGNNSLRLLKGIDLSDNNLEGQIPPEISSLVGIQLLNLSRNNLNGSIIPRIGQLTSLESLDLSHNHLSGEIPKNLAQISTLDVLDLSYNNLRGEIPIGTQLKGFNPSAYTGNPGLCGAPLAKCSRDEIPVNGENATQQKQSGLDGIMLGLYISVVLGFITGFWGVSGTLALKTSWRHAVFRFYDHIKDKIYVMVVVKARAWSGRS